MFKGQFSAMTWSLIWCQFGQQQAARQQEAVNRALYGIVYGRSSVFRVVKSVGTGTLAAAGPPVRNFDWGARHFARGDNRSQIQLIFIFSRK